MTTPTLRLVGPQEPPDEDAGTSDLLVVVSDALDELGDLQVERLDLMAQERQSPLIHIRRVARVGIGYHSHIAPLLLGCDRGAAVPAVRPPRMSSHRRTVS